MMIEDDQKKKKKMMNELEQQLSDIRKVFHRRRRFGCCELFFNVNE